MRAFPGEGHNETNTLRNCAAEHGDREREHAACAKNYPENRAGGFGARSFEVEHREHAGADADADNRGERRGAVADSDRRPVPAASARSGAGFGRLLQAQQAAVAPLLEGIQQRVQQLEALLNSGGSPADVGLLVIQIHTLQHQVAQVQQDFLSKFVNLLDPEQQQRLEAVRIAAQLQPPILIL